jgi:ABC-type glycerol-3-phosphate transport system permease component
MKQVLTTINSIVRSFSSISSRRLSSKYRLVLILPVIAMIISSCQKENLLSSSPNQDLLSSSKQDIVKKAVPFKAIFETFAENNSPIITGTGTGTHIGKSTFVATVNGDNFPLLTGTQTLTAANGDKIISSISGSVVGPDENGTLLITNNNIITGGTGRFAGATGSFIAHGIANINVPTGTVTFEGTISY